MVDLVVKNKRARLAQLALAIVATLAAAIFVRPVTPEFQDMALADGLGLIARHPDRRGPSSWRWAPDDFTRRPESYYVLILLATAGMIAMAQGGDFLIIFLGLEIFLAGACTS